MARVAVVQAGSVLYDTPTTLARMRDMLDRAARDRPELLVFPEAIIGGYPKGADFGARVGSRSEAGRDEYRRYAAGAIPVPGPETQAIGEMAAQAGAYLVVGVIERDGGTLYCTALYFAPTGALLGKHRKLVPTASERLIWGQGDGSTLGVVAAPVGLFAATICWENYMPALRQAMYGQGIQLWCAPTVDDRDIWQASMRHIAYEGRCFVLSACQYLTRADCPEDYDCIQGSEPDTVLIRGGSVIVSPFGDVLAGPVYGEPAVLCADVDLGQCVRGTYDLDVVGHYARPDVFRLTVDRTPRSAVTFSAEAPPASSE